MKGNVKAADIFLRHIALGGGGLSFPGIERRVQREMGKVTTSMTSGTKCSILKCYRRSHKDNITNSDEVLNRATLPWFGSLLAVSNTLSNIDGQIQQSIEPGQWLNRAVYDECGGNYLFN